MNSIMNFLKKYWWLFLIIIIAIPLIIHFLSPTISSEITADGMLTYIVTIISVISTIALSIITFNLAKKSNDLSEHLLMLEDYHNELEIRPFAVVYDWKAYEYSESCIINNPDKMYIKIGKTKDDNVICLSFIFQNTTQSYISIEYSGTASKDENWVNLTTNQYKTKIPLDSGEQREMVLYADKSFFDKILRKQFIMQLYLENRFAQGYIETFKFNVLYLTNEIEMSDARALFCNMIVEDYTVESCKKVDNNSLKDNTN